MESPGFSSNSNVDLKDIISAYTRHWKWFVLSVILAVSLALLYLRYTTPQYAAKGKIQILEDKNSSSELAAFQDLNIFGGAKNKVEDEIEILNSRSAFIEVVENLKLNVHFAAVGNVKSSEIYQERPFKVNFIANDSIVNAASFEFFIDISSKTSFGYSEELDGMSKVYSYGKNVPTEIGDIVITPILPEFNEYQGQKIRVKITPVFRVAEAYQEKMIISPVDELSNILTLELKDPILEKAKQIINNVILVYNRNAIEDKRIIADKTSKFIDDRIRDISTNLTSVDQTALDFKTEKGITDIAGEANLALNVGAASRQQLENTRTELNIATSMKDYVSGESGYEVLPSNVGLSDPTISNTTAKYNELVLERNRLLKSADSKNPIIVNLDQQLDGLKESMQSSLVGMERNLSMQVNNLTGQLSRINSKIYSAPKNEREFRDITRQQQTTESLYLYLLQKREESQITYASSSEKSKIIDYAYQEGDAPVSPQKAKIYLAAFVLGLLMPFSVIYANNLLDNKIHSKNELEKLVKNIPVLAELPKLSKKDHKLIHKDDRSVLAESLRILRTNLDYVIKSKKQGGKNNVIYITSSVPGEGKTFLSSNLAMIFANTEKKVLLIGADVRNPKLYSFFSGKDVDKLKVPKSERSRDIGLTEYLSNNNLSSGDIINSMLVHTHTFDVIYSGKIPPNPAELLMSSRMKELIEEVSKMYDYVIVDTAPLMVVTDTLLISEYADHIIYVTRAGVTETKVLAFPQKLKDEGKLEGLSFVVNDVKESNLGYGGKYGYGYGKSLKKWWKF